MAWYAVDLRDGVVQRVTEESNDVRQPGSCSDRSRFRETGVGQSQPFVRSDWQC